MYALDGEEGKVGGGGLFVSFFQKTIQAGSTLHTDTIHIFLLNLYTPPLPFPSLGRVKKLSHQ